MLVGWLRVLILWFPHSLPFRPQHNIYSQLANADNFASTMTVGFDALMRPQIVPSNDMGGKFNIHLEGLNRYYYVQVQAPSGLLLTSGVCNDDEVGWACDTSTAVTFDQGRDRELSSSSSSSSSSSAATALITQASIENSHRALEGEVPIGISSGRSSLCMFVDGDGNVESSFNFGVMRVGDTQNMVSNVALVLEFDDNITSSGGGRRLSEIIRRATVVDEVDNGSSGITTRYLLADEDRVAIGTVTAEVIAGTLDGRLAANGVNLDSVDPKEVIMSHTRPTDAASAAAAQAKLAVGMEIRGHYSPPPDLDFDYIVQDSINRDTATIRRGLREFNRNCREQTSKVNKEGLQESDFEAVISTSGAARPGRGGGRPTTTGGVSSNGNVFSTACSSDFLVPQYFETSLKEIETRELSEVQKLFGDATYDASDGLDSWAMGPVAGLSGLIILLMGAFVFRRALGPRSVDKFSDFNKTKDISKDETRRFGEAFDDDDSVDSAFYSDHDDDSDMELTEKERKMRRKRKEKEDEQRKGKSGGKTAKERAAERKALAKSTTKKYRKSARKGESSSSDVRKSSRKTEVTISQGSDDTGSLSDDEREKKRAAKERAAERKRLAQSEGPHRKSTSSKKKSSSSRGRNRSSGGDNRKLAASIV